MFPLASIIFLILPVASSIETDRSDRVLRYSNDEQELLHDPQSYTGSFYGTSVSLNKKYLAVGSIGDGQAPYKRSGSIYLYSTSKWQLVQKIVPVERGANYQFGSSLALCEESSTLVVGSPYAKADVNGANINCGVVHIFELDNFLDLHIQVLHLTPGDGKQYDEFGKAVAINRDTIAVAAAYHDEGRGAVYMYHRVNKLWQNQSVLSIPNDDVLYFGHSVAMGQNILAVSALHGNDASERSSIFVFERANPAFEWQQKVHLFPSNGAPGDEFGISLALSDDTLMVGARYAGINNLEKAGAVYVYKKSASLDWSESAVLTASDAHPHAFFGDTVSLGIDLLAVGCFGWSPTGSTNIVGAVYLFTRRSVGWVESYLLLSSHGSNNDFFSKALAVHGNVVAVGAAGDDLANLNSGSAFHFDLASKYSMNERHVSEGKSNYSFFISSFVLTSLFCCCYCAGCYPGKKWRRRCMKDWFGVKLGKLNTTPRKRHIHDLNDVRHTPLRLDDSQSGYLNSAEDGDDFSVHSGREASQTDEDIESVFVGGEEPLCVGQHGSQARGPKDDGLLVA